MRRLKRVAIASIATLAALSFGAGQGIAGRAFATAKQQQDGTKLLEWDNLILSSAQTDSRLPKFAVTLVWVNSGETDGVINYSIINLTEDAPTDITQPNDFYIDFLRQE